jgi:Virulence factor BrkB
LLRRERRSALTPLGWRELVSGALVGGVAFTVLEVVGGALVGRHARGASDTYGTFAVVIGLLVWLYLLAQVSVVRGGGECGRRSTAVAARPAGPTISPMRTSECCDTTPTSRSV